VVALEETLRDSELESIRNYINHNFTGWTLSELRRELSQRLAHESALYDAVLQRLNTLCSHGLLEFELSPEVHVEGAGNLLGLDLHLTREKMRDLFQALEEKKRILEMLDRFLESPDAGISVQVGLGDAHPIMRELSLVGIAIALPGGLSARIAVVGPMRMNYEKAMSAVLHMGQAFQNTAA
jgi:heat-inducible transcriptional repressor